LCAVPFEWRALAPAFHLTTAAIAVEPLVGVVPPGRSVEIIVSGRLSDPGCAAAAFALFDTPLPSVASAAAWETGAASTAGGGSVSSPPPTLSVELTAEAYAIVALPALLSFAGDLTVGQPVSLPLFLHNHSLTAVEFTCPPLV
jgi:hypothetical protein